MTDDRFYCVLAVSLLTRLTRVFSVFPGKLCREQSQGTALGKQIQLLFCASCAFRRPSHLPTPLHIHPVSILLIFPHFYLLQPLLLGKRTTILQQREESLSCQIWMHVMCRHIKRRAVWAPLLHLAAAFRNGRLWGFSFFISFFNAGLNLNEE